VAAPTVVGSLQIAFVRQVLGNNSVVGVSRALPYPSRIRGWAIIQTGVVGTGSPCFALLLADDNDTTGVENTTGRHLTQRAASFTGGLALSADSGFGFPRPGEANPGFFPLYETVTRPNQFLKLVADNQSAGAINFYVVAWLELLSTPEDEPEAVILPRGTEEEPVCVRICGDTGPQPPTPPPPAPPPPGPPPPTGPGPDDPLAEPLPGPCPIDPTAPLQSALDACATP
jgi:hypothetical protein